MSSISLQQTPPAEEIASSSGRGRERDQAVFRLIAVNVWDEVEFALRQLETTTLRRRAREWGVFYALRPAEPEEPITPVDLT